MMHDAERSQESIANEQDHTQAFQVAFGVEDAHWILGKAARELTRYHAAQDTDSRVDHLLNFASSLIALEDWTLPTDAADEGAWRGALRAESASHAFIVLIALIAKHRRLRDGRFPKVRIENGQLRAWTEDPTPVRLLESLRRVVPSATLRSIRTHIDDDQIEGYTVTVDVNGLVQGGRLVPLEQVMNDALAFWELRLPQ